eukprot:577586-Amphidinium_carterae.1
MAHQAQVQRKAQFPPAPRRRQARPNSSIAKEAKKDQRLSRPDRRVGPPEPEPKGSPPAPQRPASEGMQSSCDQR